MMDALYPHRELVCAAQDGLPDELLQYLKENTAEDIRVLLKTKTNAGLLSQCAPFTRDYPVPETGERTISVKTVHAKHRSRPLQN